MNKGTKIRTILAIATSLNTALLATDITGFHNGTLDIIYKVVSIILNFVIVALCTYYNNDYTESGEMGTRVCHALKRAKEEQSADLTLYDKAEHLIGGDEDDD